MDESEGRARKPRKAGPRMRLSGEKRARFLEVLGQTGNRGYAAEAIGVEPRLMDQRREFDPLLDRQWEEALDQADRRLAGAKGPLDAIGGAEPMVIRRGRKGRFKLIKAGGKRWSRPVEDRFFAVLASCGNIAASVRAVGFSPSCIADRRRRFADFEQRLQQALEDAELEIEFRAAAEVRGLGRAGGQSLVTVPSDCPQAPFDMDGAMRFLKWRQEKKRGGGRRGRVPAPPSIDEVTKKIIRKVEAIKRHRERRGGGAA
jgi:hypothetical protein